METLVTFKKEAIEGDRTPRLGVVLSIAFHLIIFAALFVAFNRAISSEIVAAGPGEGGEGGGGSIEVGIVHEQSPWTTHNGLRFAVETPSGGIVNADRFRVC